MSSLEVVSIWLGGTPSPARLGASELLPWQSSPLKRHRWLPHALGARRLIGPASVWVRCLCRRTHARSAMRISPTLSRRPTLSRGHRLVGGCTRVLMPCAEAATRESSLLSTTRAPSAARCAWLPWRLESLRSHASDETSAPPIRCLECAGGAALLDSACGLGYVLLAKVGSLPSHAHSLCRPHPLTPQVGRFGA